MRSFVEWWSILRKQAETPFFEVVAGALFFEVIAILYMLVQYWQGYTHFFLLFSSTFGFLLTLVSLAIFRRGQTSAAAKVISLALLVSIVIAFLPYGVSHGSIALTILAIPLIIATLYTNRNFTLFLALITFISILSLFLFEQLGIFLPGDAPTSPFINLCITIAFLGTILWTMYSHFSVINVSRKEIAANASKAQIEELCRSLDESEDIKAIAERNDIAKSAFIAAISHELRTPLHAIIAMTKYIPQDGDVNEEQRAHITRILANAEVLLRLINDVLDISKIDAGKMEIHKRAISPQELSDLLYWVVEDARILAARKHLTVYFNIPAALPVIAADTNRLRQILINLISNAVKFTEVGEIELSARIVQEHQLVIEVRDTGLGIAPPDLAIIFEPFGQAKQTSNQGGTGLGLPISQKLADLHGGAITVDSQIGNGSTFALTLPIVHVSGILAEKIDIGC